MNKYEVLGVVGEGAYGVVLRCKNKESGEIVAIKKFKESEGLIYSNIMVDDESVRKTTLREVKILRMLKQTNIIGLKEAFRRKGKLYLVFEYMEKNLLQVLEEHTNGLDHELVRVYTYQLVKAIDYCHQNGVVHRDIKPENLLVNSNHILKLCDFGFARTLSKTGNDYTDYVATRWYRAPELLLGSSSYDRSVDIWVIGCIMAELFDGQALFPGESELDQLYLIQKTLGPLIPSHMEMFLKNPRFFGFKFPDMSKHEGLDKKFSSKINKKALGFMKAVLQMDPNLRLTGHQCLNHPYFEGLHEVERRQSANPAKKSDPVPKDVLPNNPSVSAQAESRLSAQRYRNNTTFKKSSYESGFPYPGNVQQATMQMQPNQGSGMSSYPSLSALSEKKGTKKSSKTMPFDEDSEGSVPSTAFRSSKEYIDFDPGDHRSKGLDGAPRERQWKSDYENKDEKDTADRDVPDEQVKLRELMALQEQRGASRVGHRDAVLDPLPSLRSFNNIPDASAEEYYGSEDVPRGKKEPKKSSVQPLQQYGQHQNDGKSTGAVRTKKGGLAAMTGGAHPGFPSGTANPSSTVPPNPENGPLGDLPQRLRKPSKDDEAAQRKKDQVPRLSLDNAPKEPISMEELYDLRDGKQFPYATSQAVTNGKKRRQQGRNESTIEQGSSRPSTRGDMSGALDGLSGAGDTNYRHPQRPQYDADGENRPTSRSDTASEARLEPVASTYGQNTASRKSGPNW